MQAGGGWSKAMYAPSKMILTALVQLTAAVCFGQERTTPRLDKEYQLLQRPNLIRVELARRLPSPNEDPADVNKPFAIGDRLYLRLILTNTSSEPINIFLTNPYFQNRLELTKGDQVVPYLKNIAHLVESLNGVDDIRQPMSFRLKPGVPTYVSGIDLSEWYGPLPLGVYSLHNRFRFVVGGQWVETSTLAFEIIEGPVIYDEKTNRIDKLNQAQRKAFALVFDLLMKDERIPEKQLESYDVELKEDGEAFMLGFHSRSRRKFFETKSCKDFPNQKEVVGWDAYYRVQKKDYSSALTVLGQPC
jgi:hypothetical protein